MDIEKYNRSVNLLCPTCGSTEFSFEDECELVTCASCGLETTRDDLLEANRENLAEHVKEIGQEIVGDLEPEFRRSLLVAARDVQTTQRQMLPEAFKSETVQLFNHQAFFAQ